MRRAAPVLCDTADEAHAQKEDTNSQDNHGITAQHSTHKSTKSRHELVVVDVANDSVTSTVYTHMCVRGSVRGRKRRTPWTTMHACLFVCDARDNVEATTAKGEGGQTINHNPSPPPLLPHVGLLAVTFLALPNPCSAMDCCCSRSCFAHLRQSCFNFTPSSSWMSRCFSW